VTKFIRYRHNSTISYGILDGETVRQIEGGLFDSHRETGITLRLSEVKLLYPCEPSKILAVGLNYGSHLGDRQRPEKPGIFYKPVTALLDPEEKIIIPRDATNVHYEGELVIVIGKKAKDVPQERALESMFGVTCGNDVSEREWQGGAQKDLQWWRAKGCDTFAPLGPAVVTGLDCGKLMLETRLNGEVVQRQCTSDMIFDCATIIAWISRYVTLLPGDVIYTGTPGKTRNMKSGDVVEVELEGVGVLRNSVA